MTIKILITKFKNRVKNKYQFWYVNRILNKKEDQYKSIISTLIFENDITNRLVRKILKMIIYPRTQKEQTQIIENQEKFMFEYLLMTSNTKLWKKFNFEDLLIDYDEKTEIYKKFSKNVPIFQYEDFKDWIELAKNESDIIRPGQIKRFSSSAWTTAVDQNNWNKKIIPITHESMKSFTKAGQDMLAEYATKYPDTKIFKWQSLPLVWSIQELSKDAVMIWDISALTLLERSSIIKNKYAFNMNELLHKDRNHKRKVFGNKLNPNKNLVMIWVTSRANELLTYREHNYPKKYKKLLKNNNLEAVIGWWVSVNPYIKKFNKLGVKYIWNYNASEWIFGYQNITKYDNSDWDAAYKLLWNHGIFYEFIPFNNDNFDKNWKLKKNPEIKPLRKITSDDKKLALVITTNSWLLRYLIWDVINFIDNNFNFKIVGRTKQCLNLKWEELMETHVNFVINQITLDNNISINNYTIWPDKIDDPTKHERIIETNLNNRIKNQTETGQYNTQIRLTQKIDQLLQDINPDYKAKRANDILLKLPKITYIDQSEDIFTKRLSSKSKLGWQNKIPKLSHNRKILDEITEIISLNSTHKKI